MNNAGDFFSYLDARVDGQVGERETIWLSVQGYVVKLVFAGIQADEVMRINLGYLVVPPAAHADETVYVWEDSLDELMAASMIPEGERHIHYHQTPEWHVLFPGVVKRMAVRDNASHVTYVCFETGHVYPEAYVNKPFVNELQWWLWDRYLLLHGAVVGVDGVGALITAPSGKGKSTLALAGLISGMEYVSEDYVLVSREGPAVGHPILSTAYLTTQTLEMLPSLKEHALLYVDWRDKYLIDLSSFGSSFKDSMRLAALVYPLVCNEDEPSIVPAKSVKPFIAALTTTAKQIKSQGRFADSFTALFARMKTIPAYEMHLTHDAMRNAAVLREFLQGLEGQEDRNAR